MGIVPSYHDVSGGEHRLDDTAAAALLAAMGLDAGTEEAAETEVRRQEHAAREQVIGPVTVVPLEQGSDLPLRFRVPDDVELPASWHVTVVLERGDGVSMSGSADVRDPAAVLRGIGHGYHTARVTLHSGAATRSGETDLIVTPTSCWTPADAIGAGRAFGLWTNLYSVRSATNWGIGDFADLRSLIELGAREGAAFVGVNPLHALRNRGSEISPYSPVSRLYRSAAYISVPDVPEFRDSARAQELVRSEAAERQLSELRGAELIDYDRMRELKERVLRVLFEEFTARHRNAGTRRGDEFAAYVAREGRSLDEFATFQALEAHLAGEGEPVFWREWPEAFRDPASDATQRFREEHADEIDWHRWIQFELDRQLGLAAAAARSAGMPIGLYQDLAVGTSAGGSDVWAFQHLFDRGVTVGAPPDEYAASGQDWGLPPLDPNRLRDDRYRYWIRLLRAGFRHAGALRIDHAMGLVRLYWIPPGMPATEGAYVRYPAEDLIAILALESRRHRAIVIAEDLGTVPDGFEALLERWGILSSRVLWFEREEGGGFRPRDAYPERALVTTTTHDHAPLAAWLSASDAEVRRRIGVMTDEEARDAAAWRAHERAALLARLREAGLIPEDEADPPYATMLAAVYAFVAGTPARLVGVSLDDLAEETEPVNIPGVGPDRYPAWSRRMRMPLEQIGADAATLAALQAVRNRL